MSTGILEDGSLSSRLKGDIYWKKQKLMLRAETGSKKTGKGTKFFNARFEKDDEKAVGASAIDVIKSRLTDAPEDALEQQRVYTEEELNIKDTRVSPGSIGEYGEHIPDNYVSQIKNASLKVTAYHRDETFLGLSITGVHDDWLEVVWVSMAPESSGEEETAQVLAHMVNKAREEKIYHGIFAELHMSPETETMRKVLGSIGVHTFMRKNNLYECRMKDVIDDRTLFAAAKKVSCVPLLFLTDREKDEIENIIYEDTGSVPVALPIPWSSYRQDLSYVHYDADKKSLGMLFVSQVGDTMVMDLLYGKNPMVSAAILGTAIQMAREDLSPDQKLLVPIVLEATRPIVEKLAPTATREDLLEAYIHF